jgi:hypothetical protein
VLKKLIVIAALSLPLTAEAGLPRPPCGVAPTPAYGAAASKPTVSVWKGEELRAAGWQPAACLNWTGNTRLVAALAGEIRSDQTLDQLLMRLGAVSTYPSIKYWSSGRKEWRPLALEAAVVDGPAGKVARADLTPADFVLGRDNYYVERGGESGRTVHRLRVVERSADRAVIAIENVTAMKVAGFTAFEPGALQSVIFLDRRGLGVWSFYEMTRASDASHAMAAGRTGSYVNRLAAFYRHMAGIPTDLEPPLAQ